VIRAAIEVARRPSLWRTAGRQYRRTVPGRWWSARPFLPLPDPDYVRFRLLTQYGVNDRAPEPVDVVNYLLWCKQWERAA
jgi:hypothetical protein